jgi:hypothetical protein
MGRLALGIAALALMPALAGCVFDETLTVALRVEAGRTLVIDGYRLVDGTLLVERGGTLVLEDADLRIAQALVVEAGGRVTARGSTLRFEGNEFSRQDLETRGTVTLDRTRIERTRAIEIQGGTTILENATVSAVRVAVDGGALTSHATVWNLGETRPRGANEPAISIGSGTVLIQNGTLQARAEDQLLLAHGGDAAFRNLTFTGALGRGTALIVAGGDVEMRNVAFALSGGGRFVDALDGRIRFIDAPIPAREDVFTNTGGGVIEVMWTVTVRTVSPPGNIPVGGLDVTLTSASDPRTVADEGVTDENGETRLLALQYAWGREGSRTGNPHALHASGGGKEGAMLGLVFEGPATVTVPVFG